MSLGSNLDSCKLQESRSEPRYGGPMPTPEWLAEQFEEHRAHLRAVAYRMLGSASEAEDAVQESWIRLGRTDVSDVENLRAWLTTVVARVCLDMLRTRTSRREDPSGHARARSGDHPRRRGSGVRCDARGLGRTRAPRGAGDPRAGRATRVRAARRVRHDVRRDRADRGPLGRCGASAREPRAASRPEQSPERRPRPASAAARRRCVPGSRPRGRLRGSGRRARSGYRAAGRWRCAHGHVTRRARR